MIIDNFMTLWCLAWRTSLSVKEFLLWFWQFHLKKCEYFHLAKHLVLTANKQLNVSAVVKLQIHHRTPVKWNATKQFDSKQFLLLNSKLSETWIHIQYATCTFISLWLCLFFFFSRMLLAGLCLSEWYAVMLGCTCLREKCSKCVLNLSGTEYLKNLQPDWINVLNQITRNQNVWGSNGCHPVHIICSVCLCA